MVAGLCLISSLLFRYTVLHVDVAEKAAYEKVINNNYRKTLNARNTKQKVNTIVANEKNMMNLGMCGCETRMEYIANYIAISSDWFSA